MAKAVFVLQHSRERPDGSEDVKLIGVYTDRSLAEATLARLRSEPGFRDFPSGFHVESYELDKDHWEEGFVTGEPPKSWAVWRQDDNGNRFEVSRGHSREEALQLVADYESRGHKQHYWASPAGQSAAYARIG